MIYTPSIIVTPRVRESRCWRQSPKTTVSETRRHLRRFTRLDKRGGTAYTRPLRIAGMLSYVVKAVKPSPAIYREAIARAGCGPEECFYTDDIPAYVEAARREGIDAVQFQSCAQLERELAAREIRWL